VPLANPDSLLRQFTSKIQPIETDNKSINELIQQAFQLRQDAKAANITGLKEKAEAQNLLSMSSEEFKVADTILDVKKKNQALENASKKKLKAENNDLAANKIIELAKSLNESADAIDRIVQNKNNLDLKKEITNKGDQNEKSNNSDNIGKESKNKKDNEDDEKSSSKLKTFFSKKNRSENEIEYRVQIGSFVSKPNKSNFKGVRKLEITKESDLYKALVGSFDSRDEALIQKNELISKGFDAFIVTYKGGLRVK
jgi:cell division protein FtsN